MRRHYFIAVLADEAVEREVHRMKIDLHERFGTRAALKSPAHITLLAPFFFEEEQQPQLAGLLQRSVAGMPSFRVALNGFGHFSRSTIFVAVVPNPSLETLEKKVRQSLEQAAGNRDERPFHPHMTIGNRDWPGENFRKAWEEYRQKKYEAEFPVEKIVLLRLEEGKWQIVSEAKLEATS